LNLHWKRSEMQMKICCEWVCKRNCYYVQWKYGAQSGSVFHSMLSWSLVRFCVSFPLMRVSIHSSRSFGVSAWRMKVPFRVRIVIFFVFWKIENCQFKRVYRTANVVVNSTNLVNICFAKTKVKKRQRQCKYTQLKTETTDKERERTSASTCDPFKPMIPTICWLPSSGLVV
jgi:hypothetical protein